MKLIVHLMIAAIFSLSSVVVLAVSMDVPEGYDDLAQIKIETETYKKKDQPPAEGATHSLLLALRGIQKVRLWVIVNK